MIKNWQTTAGGVVAIAIAILQAFGVVIPGVSEHALSTMQTIAIAGALLRAKDKGVTGAGPSATRMSN